MIVPFVICFASAPSRTQQGGVPFPPTFEVDAGGGATLAGFGRLSSTFAGRYTLNGRGGQGTGGWKSLTVHRSASNQGVVSVLGTTATFKLERLYTAASGGRILINDTFSCTTPDTVTSNVSARCALYTNHTITVLKGTVVRLNGAFNAPQLGECSTRVSDSSDTGTNGNPSVVAIKGSTSAVGGIGGGLGLMPLDDVRCLVFYRQNHAIQYSVPFGLDGLCCPPAYCCISFDTSVFLQNTKGLSDPCTDGEPCVPYLGPRCPTMQHLRPAGL
jgi:hypothetical protein